MDWASPAGRLLYWTVWRRWSDRIQAVHSCLAAGLSRGDEIAILNGEVGEFNVPQVKRAKHEGGFSQNVRRCSRILMAPREGFEPPRPMDSGFRIHRNTGLCDLGSVPATSESEIRVTGFQDHAGGGCGVPMDI